MFTMKLASIPIDPGCADARRLARAGRLVQVKFVGMPSPPARSGFQRFLSRVIGCLAAARP
jgi:hypothetical protein